MKIINLFENFKDAKRIFSENNDPKDVEHIILQFKRLKDRNAISNEKKDISFWINKGFKEFKNFVNQKEKEYTENKQVKLLGKSVLKLYQSGDWILIAPLTQEASCNYGSNTKWCVSGKTGNKFNSYVYLDKTVMFFAINRKTGEKYAASISYEFDDNGEIEWFDSKDNSLDVDGWDVDFIASKFGFDEPNDLNNYLKKVGHDVQEKIKTKNNNLTQVERMLKFGTPYQTLLFLIRERKWNSLTDKQKNEFKIRMIHDKDDRLEAIMEYMKLNHLSRLPEYEKYLLNNKSMENGLEAASYAEEVLHKRWPEFEKAYQEYFKNNSIVASTYNSMFNNIKT